MRALLCSHNFLPLSSLSRTTLNTKPQNPKTLISNNRPRWESKLHAGPKGFQSTKSSEKPGRPDPDPEDDDPPIPQEVFERMMGRIVVSVGTPLGLGVAILKILEVVKDRHVWDVPLWVPFLTTLVTFGSSALGIAYGSLSTNLDPTKTNSVFGLKEAKENWVEMWKED
ncbi:PREDICTED: uncharacterized protein PAM68-like [Camelina sativa]|uniref:Uncharacterized protein PAM68-like n=1 Tax=Camelina sativa TaxID=90675 RepID=A0ABM0X9F4_CAMSA|nr:PREDICTED: uncharacterized protein PAM68-like [Camelina sativa]